MVFTEFLEDDEGEKEMIAPKISLKEKRAGAGSNSKVAVDDDMDAPLPKEKKSAGAGAGSGSGSLGLNVGVPKDEPMFLLTPKISVIGVGGAGGNAINTMINSKLKGARFLAANTDAQALSMSMSDCRIQLGLETTRGLGSGMNPSVGKAAAEEAIDKITEEIKDTNMLFIAVGMGGGTGTGAAPVIAKAAKEMGILTVGVVTKPFNFEGKRRMEIAEKGIEELTRHVDTIIVIPNQNLFRIATEKTSFADAFKMADNVLYSGVRNITDLIMVPGLINLDFADVCTVIAEMGRAMMGSGEAAGENRAVAAAEAAITNQLLDDNSMKGAKGILINITGGLDLSLMEVDTAAERIKQEVDPEANIIIGTCLDPELEGTMRVSVVATGIVGSRGEKAAIASVASMGAGTLFGEKKADTGFIPTSVLAARGAGAGLGVGASEPAEEKEPEESPFASARQELDKIFAAAASTKSAATPATAPTPSPVLEKVTHTISADENGEVTVGVEKETLTLNVAETEAAAEEALENSSLVASIVDDALAEDEEQSYEESPDLQGGDDDDMPIVGKPSAFDMGEPLMTIYEDGGEEPEEEMIGSIPDDYKQAREEAEEAAAEPEEKPYSGLFKRVTKLTFGRHAKPEVKPAPKVEERPAPAVLKEAGKKSAAESIPEVGEDDLDIPAFLRRH